MKRLLFFICTLLCANVIMAQTTFWIDSLQYQVTSTNPAKVEVYSSNQSIVIADIPATVTYEEITYSVTAIGDEVFKNRNSLISITIPESITSINSLGIFLGCSNLRILNFNAINCADFEGYYPQGGYVVPITSLNIGNNVQRLPACFMSNADSLTSVNIPNSVIEIGSRAFWCCDNLTSVTLPENATISTNVFTGCGLNAGLTIDNGVIYTLCYDNDNIGNYTFEDVSNVTFTIGDSVYTPSSARVYYYTSELSGAVTLLSSITSNGVSYPVTSIDYSAFENCSNLTSITIPNSVISIEHDAFKNCSNLNSVNIGNGVTSIGAWAFQNCSNLTSVTIPNSVTSIGNRAFRNCSSLTSVTCLAETAPSISVSVFTSTPSTKVLNIPCGSDYSSWQSATDWASVECTWDLGNSLTYFPLTFAIISGGERTMKVSDCDESATDVEIPARVMYNGKLYDVISIGESAFWNCNSFISNCSSLTSVNIPNSVTSIGNYAFYNCSSLTSVTIPNSVTSIGNSAFGDCRSLTSVDIPNSVTSIGNSAFNNCDSLTSVTIGNSVTSIGNWSFGNCSSLTSVNIPNSVTSIGERAFSGCGSLTSIDIPNSVTSIGNSAFSGCSSLTSVDIPNSVISIGEWAFSRCSSLTSVNIGNSVTSIGDYAFYFCTSLTSVTIPNSVTSIGNSAFSSCDSLTSVNIPNSVTSIGNSAFSSCSSLTSITIPNSVTSIGNSAFSSCDSLTSVTIPNSVTSIGGYTFYNCISLTSVNIPNSVTSIGNSAFQSCRSLTSVTIPNSVTSIGNYAFAYCNDLTSVNIPNSVTSIGNNAFAYCHGLISVTIGNSVTSIGNQAFESCNRLTSITIGNSVTSIGNYAFSDCRSLTSFTCLAETAPSLGSSVFSYTPSNKTLTVPFGASGYTSDWGNATWQKIYHKINEGEIKTLTNAFEITEDNKRGVINEGVLRITQSGQLINQTSTNVGGIIEIETPTLANDKWSFIGAPFNNYKLEVVKPGTKDISISLFDYTTGNWAEDFATIDDSVGSGEGFFAWSFAAEPTVFTTYGDGAETYNFETTPAYSLNNGAVNVTKNLTTNAEGGNWLALSNPYTFKLDVEKFLSEHGDIKGGEVYRFNGSVWTPVSEGEINMTEGFFVNFENPGTHSVSFSKFYIYEPAKSKAIEAKDYITLNVAEGENVSKLRFAQNPKAKQGDDIFDANKLFSPLEITEPYFVTDGVALVKEEVKEYPYTATLNIRNYETKEITLSIDNIPEGVNVYLIDNGFEVKMNGGVEYNTRIIAGENADRFKVLFKKQHRLERIKDNQISITNNNRQISVKSDNSDLNIEVYNQLGQKVFSTNEYNFTLSEQPAGSYVIKAYQGRFSESKKIIID